MKGIAKGVLGKLEALFDEWTGAYELIPLLALIGLFWALFHNKLDGVNFVAGLGVVLGAFHIGGAAAAKHKKNGSDDAA